MNLDSGIILPFFLIAVGIVIAIVDVLTMSKSTSAMTSRGTAPDSRRYVTDTPPGPRATI